MACIFRITPSSPKQITSPAQITVISDAAVVVAIGVSGEAFSFKADEAHKFTGKPVLYVILP